MPTYVYRRDDGTTFELVQRISEPALQEDPETGQKVQRVISGAGLVFKGSGFYLTDYARKGEKSGEKAEASGEASSAKAEASGETKAEGKAESKPDGETKTEAKAESKSDGKSAPPPAKTD